MPSEIIVKIHFAGDREPSLFPFDNIKKAAEYIRSAHPNDPISYVMEVELSDEGICRGFDAKEAFQKAWEAIEREELAEGWNDLPAGRENEHFTSRGRLDNYIYCRAEGPIFTEPGIRQSVSRHMNAGVE